MRDGISAFFDRRKKNDYMQLTVEKNEKVYVEQKDDRSIISIGNAALSINRNNKLQFKALILILADNRLITKKTAGILLNVSSSHIGYLCGKLANEDLTCLIDKRQGQMKDYVFKPEIKSELILQFVTNASSNSKTSGNAIASALNERTKMNLSERSIRYHLSKLGLKGMAEKIRNIICPQKKNSRI